MNEYPPQAVIDVLPTPTDWIKGSITPVIRNPSSDWRKNEPPGEWQKLLGVKVVQNGYNTNGLDFLNCVSFSATDVIETTMDKMMPLYHPENVQWLHDNGYMNQDGTMNFSDRFTAKVSNTTTNGNSLPAVADSIRKFGLVPETLWPMPIAEIMADPNNGWAIYYKDIPQVVLDMGQEFLKRFSHNYEWVFYPGSPATLPAIIEALKQTPLQIATAVCSGWNSAVPINGCGAGGQHATCLTYADSSGYYILDHYVQFDKKLAPNYDITSAMRHVVLSLRPIVTVSTPTNLQQQITILQKLIALYTALFASKTTGTDIITGMQTKTLFQSKTFWVAVATFVIGAATMFTNVFGAFLPANVVGAITMIVSVVSMYMRSVTTTPVSGVI